MLRVLEDDNLLSKKTNISSFITKKIPFFKGYFLSGLLFFKGGYYNGINRIEKKGYDFGDTNQNHSLNFKKSNFSSCPQKHPQKHNLEFYTKNGFSLIKEETLIYKDRTVDNWSFRMDL